MISYGEAIRNRQLSDWVRGGGVVGVELSETQRKVSQIYRLGQRFVDSDKKLLGKYIDLFGVPNSYETVTRYGRYLRAKGLYTRSAEAVDRSVQRREGFKEHFREEV